MITNVEVWELSCDECDDAVSAALWPTVKAARQYAEDEGWLELEDKHLCCFCRKRLDL